MVASRSGPVEIIAMGVAQRVSRRARYFRAFSGRSWKRLAPSVERFQPGTYTVQLKVADKVAQKDYTKEVAFQVVP